jgi:hypothetical protein
VAARPLLLPVAQKLCRCKHDVFSNRTCFHLEPYFSSKSFAAVHVVFSDTYPPKKVLNTKAKHRQVITFRDVEVFVSSGRWRTSASKVSCKLFLTNKTEELLIFRVILMLPKLTNTVIVGTAFWMEYSVWNYNITGYLELTWCLVSRHRGPTDRGCFRRMCWGKYLDLRKETSRQDGDHVFQFLTVVI